MDEGLLISCVLLVMATVLVTIVTASMGRRTSRRMRQLASLCRGLGIAVAALGALGLILGFIGMNGTPEVGHNALVVLLVSAPALFVAQRALRER